VPSGTPPVASVRGGIIARRAVLPLAMPSKVEVAKVREYETQREEREKRRKRTSRKKSIKAFIFEIERAD
jgi:hypothetical protein